MKETASRGGESLKCDFVLRDALVLSVVGAEAFAARLGGFEYSAGDEERAADGGSHGNLMGTPAGNRFLGQSIDQLDPPGETVPRTDRTAVAPEDFSKPFEDAERCRAGRRREPRCDWRELCHPVRSRPRP